MTKQEIFDKAVIGLHSQNWQRCLDTSATVANCRYNGPNNTHCAIGWVFPINSLFYEGCDAEVLLNESHIPMIPNTNNSARFYLSLQACHDNALNEHDMQERLCKFARCYKLRLPSVLKKRKSS